MLTTANAPTSVTIPRGDGPTLYANHWAPAAPRGVLVIAHGLGEHGGCYGHVAEAVGSASGLSVVAPDLRGHGLSPGRRGVVGRYDELTADLLAAFDWAGSRYAGLPRFLLGHSNGGQLALHAALEPGREGQVAGLVLSNPALRVREKVPGYKLALGRLLLRYAPGVTLGSALSPAWMTRDPLKQEEHTSDRLRHTRVNAPLFFGMIAGAEALRQRADAVRLPALFLIGGSDPVIDPAYNREFFEALGSPDKTLKVYPEAVHEPLNDLDRETVLADLNAWLNERLNRDGAGR